MEKKIDLSIKNIGEIKKIVNQTLHFGKKNSSYNIASKGLIELRSKMLEITELENNKKGNFITRLFRNEKKENEELKTAIQSLKDKVEEISDQTEGLLEEVKTDLPKIQKLTNLLIDYDKEMEIKIDIQNNRIEYLTNELQILVLRAELDSLFANSSEFNVLKKRKEQEIKSACNDLDLLKSQQIHLKIITNNLSNEEEIKMNLIDHLNNLKTLVLPTIDFSMAATIEAMKNSDALDFIQSTRNISNQLTAKSTELSQQNALKASEIQKTSAFKLDNIPEMLKLIKKTQEEISTNEEVAKQELEERQKMAEQLDSLLLQTIGEGKATKAFLKFAKIAQDKNISNEEMVLTMTNLIDEIRGEKK